MFGKPTVLSSLLASATVLISFVRIFLRKPLASAFGFYIPLSHILLILEQPQSVLPSRGFYPTRQMVEIKTERSSGRAFTAIMLQPSSFNELREMCEYWRALRMPSRVI